MRIVLYQTLKIIARLGLRLFYPFKIKRSGKLSRIKGPMILISNHPNTLIDPLFVATSFKRRLSFLANASLFKNKILNPLLNYFYCIKVERKQDNSGHPINNERAFEDANRHLLKGGAIYIAPEGTSIKGKKILPFKTGTARIAKSAFLQMDEGQDLNILPVGLTYKNPSIFGTRVAVMIGEPISIRENWKIIASPDFEGIRHFTQILEDCLKDLVIYCNSEDEEFVLDKLMEMWSNTSRLAVGRWYEAGKTLSESIGKMKQDTPKEFEKLHRAIQWYHNQSEELGISDWGLVNKNKKGIYWELLLMALLFPFYWIGLINNLLPVGLLVWISRNFNKYVEYEATIQLVGGLIFIPLFYAIQSKIISLVFQAPWTYYYLLLTITTGFLAVFYSRWLKKLENRWAAFKMDLQQLEVKRAEIVKSYLKEYS